MDFLKDLNQSQKEAATTIDGSILILAGAGSGKTKTIVSRLAYLMSLGIDPSSTLTLTFTNKAASQMRERALGMIKHHSTPPLLCTFHKFGLLFLKFYINTLGRKNNFVVIDTDDRKKILKNIDDSTATSLLASEISRYKNNFLTPQDILGNNEQKKYQKIALNYKEYQEYLTKNNLVDFDDLLLLPYQILEQNEDIKIHSSKKYQYIMVDEYQDTNDLQYKLLKTLCFSHNNLCVVGDDDQSIYGWRGANIKNILDFKEMFEDAKIIKLTQNYRSTPQILKAANDLIEHNRSRLGKNLFSEKPKGEDIAIIESFNENEEALSVARQIKNLIEKGVSPSEIAILFRINALSRSLEDGLNKFAIPYKLVGGVKFYERAEIKDLISYMRLIANPNDDFSFKRIINRPKRGLGDVTVEKLLNAAYFKNISVYELIKKHEDELLDLVGKKNKLMILDFIEKLEYLNNKSSLLQYSFIDDIEEQFGIKGYYASLPDSQDRVSNIDEFFGLYRDYAKQNLDSTLDDFLNDLSLTSEQDMIEGEKISIMSIHASKGLEFEYLFVIGLEEGFFPIIGDGSDIEEERRLGYVAITRAKSQLTLCYSHSRFYKGKRAELLKSRFLNEAGLLGGGLKIEKTTNFKKGDLVRHKIFGIGRVLDVSKAGKDFKLKLNFAGTTREILASFIEKI